MMEKKETSEVCNVKGDAENCSSSNDAVKTSEEIGWKSSTISDFNADLDTLQQQTGMVKNVNSEKLTSDGFIESPTISSASSKTPTSDIPPFHVTPYLGIPASETTSNLSFAAASNIGFTSTEIALNNPSPSTASTYSESRTSAYSNTDVILDNTMPEGLELKLHANDESMDHNSGISYTQFLPSAESSTSIQNLESSASFSSSEIESQKNSSLRLAQKDDQDKCHPEITATHATSATESSMEFDCYFGRKSDESKDFFSINDPTVDDKTCRKRSEYVPKKTHRCTACCSVNKESIFLSETQEMILQIVKSYFLNNPVVAMRNLSLSENMKCIKTASYFSDDFALMFGLLVPSSTTMRAVSLPDDVDNLTENASSLMEDVQNSQLMGGAYNMPDDESIGMSGESSSPDRITDFYDENLLHEDLPDNFYGLSDYKLPDDADFTLRRVQDACNMLIGKDVNEDQFVRYCYLDTQLHETDAEYRHEQIYHEMELSLSERRALDRVQERCGYNIFYEILLRVLKTKMSFIDIYKYPEMIYEKSESNISEEYGELLANYFQLCVRMHNVCDCSFDETSEMSLSTSSDFLYFPGSSHSPSKSKIDESSVTQSRKSKNVDVSSFNNEEQELKSNESLTETAKLQQEPSDILDTEILTTDQLSSCHSISPAICSEIISKASQTLSLCSDQKDGETSLKTTRMPSSVSNLPADLNLTDNSTESLPTEANEISNTVTIAKPCVKNLLDQYDSEEIPPGKKICLSETSNTGQPKSEAEESRQKDDFATSTEDSAEESED